MATLRGGDKFQAALREISKKISRPATLRVGFLEGSSYPDGTSVPMVAAINEFGAASRGQPARPFFRNMIADHEKEWPAGIAAQLKATAYDVAMTLERTGVAIAGQLRQSIVDLVEPPLAPSTIRRKGSDKPLIDTGHMLNSVDFEVKT